MALLLVVAGCNLADKSNDREADVGEPDTADVRDTEAISCDGGLSFCDDRCVDIASSADHCGSCGRACEAPNAVSGGCQMSVCQLSCEVGFLDENGDLDELDGDGCETVCEPTDDGTEVCDGVDNDCDGEIDEGVLKTWYLDADSDGFGQDQDAKEQCDRPSPRYVEEGGDCNDADDTIWPGGEEVCDGKDNDCDEQVDEGVETTFYLDSDGDGWGTEGSQEIGCTAPDGYVDRSGDCDDTDSDANPDQTNYFAEERNGGGHDYDCNGDEDAELQGVSNGECVFAGQCNSFSSQCVPHPDAWGWRNEVASCGAVGEVFAGCQSCVGGIGNCGGTAFYDLQVQRCR